MGLIGRLAGRPQRHRKAIFDLDMVDDWSSTVEGYLDLQGDELSYNPSDAELAAGTLERAAETTLTDYNLDFEGDPYETGWDLDFTAGLNYGTALRQAARDRADRASVTVRSFDPDAAIDDVLDDADVSREVGDGVRSGSQLYDKILTQPPMSGYVMGTNPYAYAFGSVERGQQRANVIRAGMNPERSRDYIRLPGEDRSIKLAVPEPAGYTGILEPGGIGTLGSDSDKGVIRDLPPEVSMSSPVYLFSGSYASESVHRDRLERLRLERQ